MGSLMNALACVLALGNAMFLWRGERRFLRTGFHLLGLLLIYGVFTFFAADSLTPQLETYPFLMLALTLCCSTSFLTNNRRRYMLMAQSFWLWVEFFGGLSLYYRGVDAMPWMRLVALCAGVFGVSFLSKISREMEFCLLVFWIAIWMLF